MCDDVMISSFIVVCVVLMNSLCVVCVLSVLKLILVRIMYGVD